MSDNKKKPSESCTDPLQLPMPGDYDDYWYQGEDGEWYNEYDDELEEGHYYTKDRKLPDWCSAPKGVPKPVDYEDYWYEGEDGSWYNEYDDELYPGQYYVDTKTDTQAENKKIEEEKRKAEEKRRVEEARKKAEEDAKRAKEEATRKAKEAAKAAEEAAKEAKAAASNLMKGFGGGLFGKQEQKKPPAKQEVKQAPASASASAPTQPVKQQLSVKKTEEQQAKTAEPPQIPKTEKDSEKEPSKVKDEAKVIPRRVNCKLKMFGELSLSLIHCTCKS